MKWQTNFSWMGLLNTCPGYFVSRQNTIFKQNLPFETIILGFFAALTLEAFKVHWKEKELSQPETGL